MSVHTTSPRLSVAAPHACCLVCSMISASLAHRALSRRVTNEVQVYYGITASAPKASSARKHGSTMTQQELVTAQWTAAYAANVRGWRCALKAPRAPDSQAVRALRFVTTDVVRAAISAGQRGATVAGCSVGGAQPTAPATSAPVCSTREPRPLPSCDRGPRWPA